jgi:MarR family transcriptional regulator, organic hydroperoxide resistance regulator
MIRCEILQEGVQVLIENDKNEARSYGPARIGYMLCFALYAASRATMDVYRPLLDELGLTYPQYLVMIILWEHKTSSVKDIGAILHLDSGTLSPLLKRLEAAGLIKRQRRSDDERVVNITLTEAGQALEERAAHIPEKFGCELDLEYDEYVELMKYLKQLVAKINHISP